MTNYRVIITPQAQQNINDAFDYIADRSPLNADKWVRGLRRRIDDLGIFPRGFGHAREQVFFEDELRQLVYKSHRIIYTVDDNVAAVIVLEVRHGKRRTIGEQPDVDD